LEGETGRKNGGSSKKSRAEREQTQIQKGKEKRGAKKGIGAKRSNRKKNPENLTRKKTAKESFGVGDEKRAGVIYRRKQALNGRTDGEKKLRKGLTSKGGKQGRQEHKKKKNNTKTNKGEKEEKEGDAPGRKRKKKW